MTQACTICKANQAKEAEDDEREYTLLKEAIAELEKGLGNTDNDEEAQALQLLAGVRGRPVRGRRRP